MALALPAAAARPDGKGKPAKSGKTTTTAVTEDNDTNDGNTPNNVVDDGDNRHPSGKDKSVESGRSSNQGKSTSDPDDDGRGPDRSNGGADKPDGPGGVDLADQDGNNGCGNDDDFEDDNEGWCGRNPKRGGPGAQPAPAPGPGPETGGACEAGNAKQCEGAQDSCTVAGGTADCEVGDDTCTPGSGAGGADCDDAANVVEGSCDAQVPECLGDGTGSGDTGSADAGTGSADGGADAGVVSSPHDTAGTDLGDVLGAEGEVQGETAVAGVALERTTPTTPRILGSAVLGAGLARVAGASAVLAATGVPALLLALLALSGIGAGATLVRRSRRG